MNHSVKIYLYFCAAVLCNAQPTNSARIITIDDKILSSLRIEGLNQKFDIAAKFVVRSVDGAYVMTSAKGGSDYGVVFLEKYMGGLPENNSLIKGIPHNKLQELMTIMDKSIKDGKVSGWLIFRHRSSGREFVGFYEGREELR